MFPLLKRVTVLLLTTVMIGGTTFSDSNFTANENYQDAKNFRNKTQNNTSKELPVETNPDMVSRSEQTKRYVLSLPVGLVFLSLSILTFALRCHKNKGTNVILINLCTTLLLHQLVDLVILIVMQPNQKLYTVLERLSIFLLLSSFAWMLIEAVLLLVYVKSLSKIRSEQGTVISWKWFMVVGYAIPLTFLGISAVICSFSFGGVSCDLNKETATFLIFWIPIIYIALPNVVLYTVTIIIMIIMLRKLKNGAVQSSNAVNKHLIFSVVFKSLAQFLILICPWILRLFQSKMVLDLALILISQQGTFIFLIHCVLNQEVREMYWKVLRPLCPFIKTGSATLMSQMTA